MSVSSLANTGRFSLTVQVDGVVAGVTLPWTMGAMVCLAQK